MASNVPLSLALVTSCLLVTGCLCLECLVCNDLDGNGCSNNPIAKNCSGDNNICSEVSFSTKIGNKVETRIVKACEKGSVLNSISKITSNGFQIITGKNSCNSSLCNENVNDLSNKFTEDQASSTSGLECYSCLSTNKSECSMELAVKVKCPGDLDACYQAEGKLTLGGSSLTIFVKQCSVFTNDTTIVISDDWFNMTLIAAYCTGNLCNENLFPAEPTEQVLTTEVTTSAMNSTTSTSLPPVTSIIKTTTSGIGRTYPCYVAIVILVAMESFL